MQIRIEVEVSPEELRRFLGLPDVAGLQEDVVNYLRDKVGAAGDFDAAAFVKGNLELLRRHPALKLLLAAARSRSGAEDGDGDGSASTAETDAPSGGSRRRPRTAGSKRRRT